MHRPTELFAFLDEMGLRPKKRLSQNFLTDGNILRKIVRLAEIQPQDLVLEIGPGPGALTEVLLAHPIHLIAVEKDVALAEALQNRKNNLPGRLEVLADDFLALPLEETLKKHLLPSQKAKIVANLPYHLTTPILARLLPHHSLISSLTVMVQKEVAERMCGTPNTADYSSFSIFLAFYADVNKGFTVSRHCFYPVPKVDSQVVHLSLRPPPLTESSATQFFQLTRTAFGKRRKMLRSSLKELYPAHKVEEALAVLQKPVSTRPQELHLTEFLALYRLLTHCPKS